MALARRITQMLLDELSISFSELAEGTHFRVSDLETERAPSGVAPLSEPTLALTFEGKLGRMSATLVILMPHRAVEPVLIASDPAVAGPEIDAAGAVGEALGMVQVQLRAEVGSVDLALDEVLALRAGDVVSLGSGAGDGGVTLFADNVALHRGRLGRNGRRRAVQVVEQVEEER
jgi:flagellar motor switch protein FliM